MKKKTINAVLCKKFDEFVKSIEDITVQNLVKDNSIITGGCIASMLLGEKVNDFDVYFTNKPTVLAVSEYYVKQFNKDQGAEGFVLDGNDLKSKKFEEWAIKVGFNAENGEEDYLNQGGGVGLNMTADRVKIIFKSKGIASEVGYGLENEDSVSFETAIETMQDITAKEVGKKPFRPVFLSCNAITLSNQVQLVIRFYGEAKDIHDNYDFVHCTNYWTSKSRQLTLNQEALECILAKELKYIGSKYPLASVIRTRKFIQRQWTINAGQYLKMAYQVSKLNLEDVNVLEDQLVGVDSAYFETLISALQTFIKNQKETGSPITIDYSYLATIIDRIF